MWGEGVVTYVPGGRGEVEAALVEVVLLRLHDGGHVEAGEESLQGASVPVIGDAPPVVTLARQVRQSHVLHLLQSPPRHH